MADDIKLVWDNDQQTADINLISGDIETDDTLITAVLISLFTDMRADEDDTLINPADKRGWWGDQISEVEGDQIGSKIWLLYGQKINNNTINKLQQYAYNSLEWLLEDGVASNIIVTAERNSLDRNRVDLLIEIYKDYDTKIALKFNDLWDNLNLKLTLA